MRSIVKVLAETTTEVTWDGLTLVKEVLIIDVGGPDSQQALKKANVILQEHGWKDIDQQLPKSITMQSSQWENTRLSLYSLEFSESIGPMDPRQQKAIKDAQEKAGAGAGKLLIMKIEAS
ncbi:hypothetical protein [Streptosporangium sp. NPDC002721]|uniref:hypothetical protein n=1 Tax=Streptosporangium sp. NPDC002721 TaxID=3366188 RepID=UPI0036BB9280